MKKRILISLSAVIFLLVSAFNVPCNAATAVTIETTGRVFAIPVEFSDSHEVFEKTKEEIYSVLFGTEVNSVYKYFYENSYGRYKLSGTVTDIVKIGEAKRVYSADVGDNLDQGAYSSVKASSTALATDVFTKFYDTQGGESFNFAPYVKLEGSRYYISNLMFVCQGMGYEDSGFSDDFVSRYVTGIDVDTGRYYNNKKIYIKAFSIVPEQIFMSEPVGITAKVLGQVMGLPLLNDTTERSYGVGKWSLMGYGFENGETIFDKGRTPAHLSAWEKLKLGWANAISINSDVTGLVIKPVETSGEIYKISSSKLGANEYFLLENRQNIGYDAHLPGEGLLIWHIDESVQNNDNESRFKVALEQADGQKDMENRVNQGDEFDPYPCIIYGVENKEFGSNTNPSSKSNSGAYTNILIKNITREGDNIRIDVSVSGSHSATSAAVDSTGTKITVTYNAPVKDSTISAGRFKFEANDGEVFQIKSAARSKDNHNAVILELGRVVYRSYTDLKLSYTYSDSNGVISEEGVASKEFSNMEVSNGSTIDCPYPVSAVVNDRGTRITLTYNMDIVNANTNNKNDFRKENFSITINGANCAIEEIKGPFNLRSLEIYLAQQIYSTDENILLNYTYTENCVVSKEGIFAGTVTGFKVKNNSTESVPAPSIVGVNLLNANLEYGKISGEVVIVGEYLDAIKEQNEIFFVDKFGNETEGTILSVSVAQEGTYTLRARIPQTLGANVYSIKLVVHGQIAQWQDAFTITPSDKPLAITSIVTSQTKLREGSISGTITIRGTNFGATKEENTVKIVSASSSSTITPRIISAGYSEIVIEAPASLKAGVYRIRVAVGGKEVTSQGAFTVLEPIEENEPEDEDEPEDEEDPEDEDEPEDEEDPDEEDPEEIEEPTYLSSKTQVGKNMEQKVIDLYNVISVQSPNSTTINETGKIVKKIIELSDKADDDDEIKEAQQQIIRANYYVRALVKNTKIKDSQKESLIEDMADLMTAAFSLAEKIDSEEYKMEYIQRTSSFIADISSIKAELKEIDDMSPIISMMKNMLKDIEKATEDMDKEQYRLESIRTALKHVNSIASATEAIEEIRDELEDEISSLVDRAFEDHGTENISVSGSGKAKISEELVTNIVNKARTLSGIGRNIVEEAKKIIPDKTIESKFTINFTSSNNPGSIEIEFPGNIYRRMDETGIAAWEIKTRYGNVKIRRGSLNIGQAQSTSFSLREVKNNEIAADYRDYVGNKKVYDFAISYKNTSGTVMPVEKFIKEIKLGIPFDISSGQSASKVAVIYLSPDGIPENMLASYDKASKTAYFWTIHLSQYMVCYNDIYFSDVNESNWAKEYIEKAAAKDIAKGKGAGIFDPYGNVTRAEFASYIIRTFKAYDNTAKSPFKDVQSGSWYYLTVLSAARYGIVRGTDNGRYFDPNGYITRQDMAVMLGRAINQFLRLPKPVDSGKAERFKDAGDFKAYAKEGIRDVVNFGIMTGKPGNYFAPYDHVTRGEAVAVICRMLDLKPEE